MDSIVVVTQDVKWKNGLLRCLHGTGQRISFIHDLRSENERVLIDKCDWVIVDLAMLPQPESPTINQLREWLRGKAVLVAHSDSDQVNLTAYRAANIIGALDVIERPLTPTDLARCVRQSVVKLERGEVRGPWLPSMLHL